MRGRLLFFVLRGFSGSHHAGTRRTHCWRHRAAKQGGPSPASWIPLGTREAPPSRHPPPFVSSFLESGGPPHLWDGSSLGARKLRGEPLPQHPSPEAQAGKAVGLFLLRTPPEIWLPWDPLTHYCTVPCCGFVSWALEFRFVAGSLFFHCYCLAHQNSPSARGYGHGRQGLRNAPGPHQVGSGFCCLGRAGLGKGEGSSAAFTSFSNFLGLASLKMTKTGLVPLS